MRPREENTPGVYMREWPIWGNLTKDKALWEAMW